VLVVEGGEDVKQLEMFREIIVDNFAGGGGASTGISQALGRSVDIAINHDPAAIAMHMTNHPDTEHYCENVWEIDPRKVAGGRPVALVWLSPDCKHFSKAKGGRPVEKGIRGLAWVAVRWAATVRPRVIMLENVEEFKTWGPLTKDGYPDPDKKGRTFNSFINALKRQGYYEEHKELRACDYGAPTSRKRFFMIARRDGQPIVWPEPTHGDPKSEAVKSGRLKPWRTAAEIIDWTLPCPSIFTRKKPLAENTMKRIARGIQKFVIENPEPFIVRIGQQGFSGDGTQQSLGKPLSTIVTKAEHCLIAPFLSQYHSYDDSARGQELSRPLLTLDTSNRYALVSAFMAKHYGGNYEGAGTHLREPLSTVTTKDHNALVTAFVSKFYKTGIGQKVDEPLHTITTSPGHFAEVRAFLLKYYGTGVGQIVNEPLGTVTSKHRFGLVTVHGVDYQTIDIGMRMLAPRELFNAQGFPGDYIIDRDDTGKPYSISAQVARCGNSVSPPLPFAMVRANLPDQCRMAA